MRQTEDNRGYVEVDECRACGGTDLSTYLDLGMIPLSNGVLTPDQVKAEKKFPLSVNFCQDCSFSQLSVSVDPEILFRNYVYRSSISQSFADHCRNLAAELRKDGLDRKGLVVDIASNDGCLLRQFIAEGAENVLGVDPARNLAKIAEENGVRTVPEFWAPEVSTEILKEHGSAKVITAFNVFAHVPNVRSFLTGVKTLLDRDGYFILESPHLLRLIENVEFDTIYHEHHSYLLLKPIIQLAENAGLRVAKAREMKIHGGTMRLFFEHSDRPSRSNGSVASILEKERDAGLYTLGGYSAFRDRVEALKTGLVTKVSGIKSEGKRIAGFGASAKGNVLLNYCGIGRESIEFIVDDTPEKQGRLYAGVHIPISQRSRLMSEMPDYLLILAWNFSEEIMRKTRDYSNAGGKYLIPLPHVQETALIHE